MAKPSSQPSATLMSPALPWLEEDLVNANSYLKIRKSEGTACEQYHSAL